jgi:hypothetical protein
MLEQLAPDLYAATDRIRLGGGVALPLRMTIVRLPSEGLLLYSPIRPTDELAEELAALGPVKHVVAPNCFHHLYGKYWLDRHPDAELHGAPGLADKRKDLHFASTLSSQAPAAWRDVIDQELIAGAPRIGEVVMLHRPSRTLLVADLMFNLHGADSVMSRLTFRLMGVHGRLAKSRVWRLLRKQPAAFDASLDRVLGWDFDRLVPCHGDVVESGAHAAVAAALGRAEAASAAA